MWRADRNSASVRQVTFDEGDVEEFDLSSDGLAVRYVAGPSRSEIARAEQEEYDAGIRIDTSVPIGQALFRSGYINGRLATQRFHGRWFTRRGLLDGTARRLKVVEIHSGNTRAATKQEIDAFASRRPVISGVSDLSPVVQSEESGLVAYRLGERSTAEIRVLDPTGIASEKRCNFGPCESLRIEGLAWRPGYPGELIFTGSDRARGYAQSLFSWDTENGSVRLITSADGLLNGDRNGWDSTCAVGRDSAYCVFAGADQAPRLESVDLATGDRKTIFQPNETLTPAAALPAGRGRG